MVSFDNFLSGAAGGATVAIVIKAVDDYSKELKKAQTGLDKFGTIAKGVAIAAAGAFASFAATSIKAGAEVELLNRRLEFSFGNMADAVEDASKRLRDSSTISTEEFKQAFLETKPVLDTFGFTFEQQSQLIARATDLASASGRDFNQVLDVMTTGLSKPGVALRELGISIENLPDNLTASQKAALIFNEELTDTASVIGAGKAEKNTVIGGIKDLKINLEDLQQSFGTGFLQNIQGVNGGLSDMNRVMVDLQPAMARFGGFTAEIGNFLARVAEDFNRNIDMFIRGGVFIGQITRNLQDGMPITEAWGQSWKDVDDIINGMNARLLEASEKTAQNSQVTTQNSNVKVESAKTIAEANKGLAESIPKLESETASVDKNTAAWQRNSSARATGFRDNRVSSGSGVMVGNGVTAGRDAQGRMIVNTGGALARGYGTSAPVSGLGKTSFGSVKKHKDASMLVTPQGTHLFDPQDNISLNASKKGSGANVINLNFNIEGNLTSMDNIAEYVDRYILDRLRSKITIGL